MFELNCFKKRRRPCKNCDIVNRTFAEAEADAHMNLVPVHRFLCERIKTGRMVIFAGDCPFEKMMQVLNEEKHYTVCFYLQCPECGDIYFIGACIRGKPIYKKVIDIDKENIADIIWGSEGIYFEQNIGCRNESPGGIRRK